MSTLLSLRRARLGSDDPLIAPTTTSTGHLFDWLRHLSIGGAEALHIGNACDTCGFFFERASTPIDSDALARLRQALGDGLGEVDDAVASPFGALLPKGEYFVTLLECVPVRVEPGQAGDYFHEEQARLEGFEIGDEYNGPLDTNTHYYRLHGRSGFESGPGWYGGSGSGFDFIAPFARPTDSDTSDAYAARMTDGARPTAVAFSLLDIKQRHDRDAHWCMAHYLLDGHHKVDAAARLGRPITLLSFIPLEGGFCNEDQLESFLATYPRPVEA